MELDPIAFIDIVQIRAVTGTPALFNKLLLPRTLTLMPHEKKSSYGHSGLCAPGPVSIASLP